MMKCCAGDGRAVNMMRLSLKPADRLLKVSALHGSGYNIEAHKSCPVFDNMVACAGAVSCVRALLRTLILNFQLLKITIKA
nr:hypothetical protein CFP56_65561 [Quercus suber]